MPALAPCGADLIMIISGVPGLSDLTFSIVGRVRTAGSVALSGSPIPDGTTSTDHINTQSRHSFFYWGARLRWL